MPYFYFLQLCLLRWNHLHTLYTYFCQTYYQQALHMQLTELRVFFKVGLFDFYCFGYCMPNNGARVWIRIFSWVSCKAIASSPINLSQSLVFSIFANSSAMSKYFKELFVPYIWGVGQVTTIKKQI